MSINFQGQFTRHGQNHTVEYVCDQIMLKNTADKQPSLFKLRQVWQLVHSATNSSAEDDYNAYIEKFGENAKQHTGEWWVHETSSKGKFEVGTCVICFNFNKVRCKR